jgi:hypothetical protein
MRKYRDRLAAAADRYKADEITLLDFYALVDEIFAVEMDYSSDEWRAVGERLDLLAAVNETRMETLLRLLIPEFCICAAVKTAEGRIIRGHRHDGAIITAGNMGLKLASYDEDQQGFVTSRGRYVNRTEAAALQRAAGIRSIDERHIDFPDELFSEDLY